MTRVYPSQTTLKLRLPSQSEGLKPHLHLPVIQLARLSGQSVSCYALAPPQVWRIRPRTPYKARFSLQTLPFNGVNTIVPQNETEIDIEKGSVAPLHMTPHRDDRRGVMIAFCGTSPELLSLKTSIKHSWRLNPGLFLYFSMKTEVSKPKMTGNDTDSGVPRD